MPDVPDCPLCVDLWRAFTDATMEHDRLDIQLRLARLLKEGPGIADLTPKVEAAENTRSNAQQAAEAHEAEVHPQRDTAKA